MKSEITNEIWQLQTLRLVQALLGAISENFRMVALGHEDQTWRLIFVLGSESAEDRNEIDDVGHEFEALQDKPTKYRIDVVISQEALDWPGPPARVVYRRRET